MTKLQEDFTYRPTQEQSTREDGTYIKKLYRSDPFFRRKSKSITYCAEEGLPLVIDGLLIESLGFVPSKIKVQYVR